MRRLQMPGQQLVDASLDGKQAIVLRADYAYGGSLGVASLPVSGFGFVACRCQGSNSLIRVIGYSAIRVSTSRRNASGLWPLSLAVPSKL